jgi:hypothetical protein
MKLLNILLQLAALAAPGVASFPAEGKVEPTATTELASHVFPRATSFQCPVFTKYAIPNVTCPATDVHIDSVESYGKTVFLYAKSSDPLIAKNGIASLNTRIGRVKTAITAALKQYSGWGGKFKVHIGLLGELDGGGYGKAQPVTYGTAFRHCNVLIALYNNPISTDALLRIQKAVVHEIYHCVQYAENLAGKRKAADGLDDWWIEGTARFMDGEIYPITPGSGVTDMGLFPEAYNPAVSIVEQAGQGYSAALFFHYVLSTGRSVANVNDWVAAKVGQTSVANEHADLAADRSAALSFPKNWHGFAVAFADRKIKYRSSGDAIVTTRSLTYTPFTQTLVVGQITPSKRTVKPFTFDAVRYTFAANTANFLQLPGPTALRCSFRLKGSAAWVTVTSGSTWEYIPPATSGTSYIDTLCSCSGATTCSGTFNTQRAS